jgi:hypothetical protein
MKIHRHPLDFLNPIIGAWVGGEKSTFTHPSVYLSQVSVLVMIAFSVKSGSTEHGDCMRVGLVLGLPALRLGNQQIPSHREQLRRPGD